MSSIVQGMLEPSGLLSIVFGTVLVSAQAVEIYFTFLPVRFVSKSLWPLKSRWAEGLVAVPKNVIRVVQDFVSLLLLLPPPIIFLCVQSQKL